MGYQPAERAGSHLKLRYKHPKTGEIRIQTQYNTSNSKGKDRTSAPMRGYVDGRPSMIRPIEAVPENGFSV